MVKFVIFLAAITLNLHLTYAQSMIQKVANLDIIKAEGEVTTYYSQNYSVDIEKLQTLLHNSSKYFEKEFNIERTFALAVLDSSDWSGITKIPYGLPFVSGPPYIVCLPADSKHELARIIESALRGSKVITKYSLSRTEIVSSFISMIGFHELGHIYAKAYGIKYPNKWVYEFIATYFAYLYLANSAPESANLWLEIAALLEQDIEPKYTSVADFEKLYVRVGVENYA